MSRPPHPTPPPAHAAVTCPSSGSHTRPVSRTWGRLSLLVAAPESCFFSLITALVSPFALRLVISKLVAMDGPFCSVPGLLSAYPVLPLEERQLCRLEDSQPLPVLQRRMSLRSSAASPEVLTCFLLGFGISSVEPCPFPNYIALFASVAQICLLSFS